MLFTVGWDWACPMNRAVKQSFDLSDEQKSKEEKKQLLSLT